jgi:ribose transport system permease protein
MSSSAEFPVVPAVESPIRSRRGIKWARFLPVVTLVALILIIGGLHPLFFSGYNLQELATAAGPLSLLACGEFAVVLLGGIDLSIGQISALGTVLLAIWLGHAPGALVVVAVVAILGGMGALNGVVMSVAKIPSFITTLGTLGLWTGVALVISGETSVPVNDMGPLNWFASYTGGVPNDFIVAIVAAAVFGLCLQSLPGGRLGMYAVGRAESTALMSGMRVGRIRVAAFAISGLFAGLAAIELTALYASGDPQSAASLLLPAIAAVVVGGNAITGGVGSVTRAVIGASIITVVDGGIGIIGINPYSEQILYGLLLIVTAGLTLDRSHLHVVK